MGVFQTDTATGRSAESPSAWGSQIEFVTNDSNPILNYYMVNGTVTIYVDGVQEKTLSTTNSTFYSISLYNTARTGSHTIRIKRANSGAIWFDNSGVVTIDSSSSISAPTGYSSELLWNTGTLSSNSRRYGGWQNAAVGTGYSNLITNASGVIGGKIPSLWFYSTATTVRLWMLSQGQSFILYSDGINGATSTVTASNSGTFDFLDISLPGSDGSTSREYILLSAQPAQSLYVNSAMFIGGSLSTHVYSAPVLTVAMNGDSIFQGTGLSNNSQTIAWALTTALNWDIWNNAAAGTSMKSSGASTLSSLAAKSFDASIDNWGINDLFQVAGAETSSEYQNYVESRYSTIKTTYPSMKVYSMGLTNTFGQGTDNQVPTWNSSKSSAVSAQSSSNIKFFNPYGVLGSSSYFSDNVHPNPAGVQRYVNWAVPLLSDTGYTVTGPTSGTSGQASTNYTVTIANGVTFTGLQTITISDGSEGGTFTPSVGSASSSSVTVTPTNGATSFTFTYTPASSGVKTLTFTNAQGWTDASSTTYTASSPVTPPTLTIQAASPVSTSTATLNGTIVSNNNASSTVVGFNYGTTTAYGSVASTTGTFDIGSFSELIISLTPNTLYHFQAFATNSAGTGTSTDYATTTLILVHTITSSAGSNGSISPLGVVSVNDAADQAFTITPDSGYVVSALTVDGSPISTSTTYTFSNVTTDHTISATFVAQATPDVASPVTPTVSQSSSGSSVQTRVRNLLSIGNQQAAEALMKQYPAQFPNQGIQTTTASSPSFIRNLSPGTTDTDIKLLQIYLNTHGFPIATTGAGSPGHETLYFGPATKAALIKFQTANNILPAIGDFGPRTRALLNKTSTPISSRPATSTVYSFTRDLEKGMTGEDVKALQIYLNTHGFTVALTGVGSSGQETTLFGPATQAALIKFQKANGITPSEGYFGQKTRQYILSH
jgi:hypothetical protein